MNSKQNLAATEPALLTVSPSPHARRGATTSSVMLDVIIALLPATIWGAVFNWISGFIPMLFLPKINGFMNEFTLLENSLTEAETLEEIAALMMPLLETYGFTLALYAIYLFLVFAINMTGLVLLCLNLKTLRKMKEESLLTFKETVKAVIVNPGMIVCTALLGVLTVFSLFS